MATNHFWHGGLTVTVTEKTHRIMQMWWARKANRFIDVILFSVTSLHLPIPVSLCSFFTTKRERTEPRK